MYGPSGFFADIPEDDSIVSGDLELFRDSPEGFTMLYRCQRSGRFFIYKSLKPGYRGIQTYEDLLRKDFEIGFSLQHPNICQYFAFVNLPGIGNSIVMEWIDGEDLGQFLAGHRDRSSAVTDRILAEICDALSYLHRKQVIHRDLKPENIMVTFNGLHPKLIDFGLSDTDSFAMLKVAAGTQYYASPELLAGDNVDSRTDIWSLGIIMQELGRRYRRVSAKCLKRNPADRYPNAESVAADIAGLGKGRGMWLGIAAALVALFVLAGFLGRDFLGIDTGRSGYQADSLGHGFGPSVAKDGVQAGSEASPAGLHGGPAGDGSGMAYAAEDAADGDSGGVSGGVSDGISGGISGGVTGGSEPGPGPGMSLAGGSSAKPSSKSSTGTTSGSANGSSSKTADPSASEHRTALDSTALDALFREAADELEVGE
ncbi:MAG: serine/threonine-protein kinase [Candidatus Cryptobacteroides sp.]